jgi:hypothetical protein
MLHVVFPIVAVWARSRDTRESWRAYWLILQVLASRRMFWQSALDVMPVPIMSSFSCPSQNVRLFRSVFANCSGRPAGVPTPNSMLYYALGAAHVTPSHNCTDDASIDPSVYTAHSAVHRGIRRRRRSRAACTPCIHPTRHTHAWVLKRSDLGG